MNIAKQKNKILAVLMAFALAVTLTAGFSAMKAYAASGNVYTCVINRCYAHPLTGEIEDSGGESSYATGQGMVEGCVYDGGILEVTDDGAYYLTIRLSLMDYTSDHSFWVQSVGDTGWSSPSEIGITATGTDSNGSTADVCMRVPSENCIIRGSMYVEPMGRYVIFYVYPSDYSEGNNTDMNATMVTTGTAASGNDGSASGTSATSGTTGSSLSSGNTSLKSTDTSENETVSESETTAETGEDAPKLQSSITEAVKPGSDSDLAGTQDSLNQAEGLSLSTAESVDTTDSSGDTVVTVSGSDSSHIFQAALAVVVSGLILIGVAAGVVYFFRKNWKRWGGADDDDE